MQWAAARKREMLSKAVSRSEAVGRNGAMVTEAEVIKQKLLRQANEAADSS